MFSDISLDSATVAYHSLYTKNEVPKVAEGDSRQV